MNELLTSVVCMYGTSYIYIHVSTRYLHSLFALSAGRSRFGSGGGLGAKGRGQACRWWRRLMSCNGVMEEDPLATTSCPGLVLAEAGGLLEAEAPWRPGRGAGLRLGLALAGQGFIPPGGNTATATAAGRVGAAVGGRQVGQLGGGALAVQQGGEILPHPQVRARVGPLAL